MLKDEGLIKTTAYGREDLAKQHTLEAKSVAGLVQQKPIALVAHDLALWTVRRPLLLMNGSKQI